MKTTNQKTKIAPIGRNGFTLLEMLVVVLIIALLAGLATLVFRTALTGTKDSIIKAQMGQLALALDNYKIKVGEYPPDDYTDTEAMRHHIHVRWPRMNYRRDFLVGLGIDDLNGDGLIDNVDAVLSKAYGSMATAATASFAGSLVFWMGGLPDANGKPNGFYKSPSDPLGLDTANTPDQREEIFYSFPADSIITNFGVPAFCLRECPILYFRAQNGDYTGKSWTWEGFGIATPYGFSDGSWEEPKRFQLIHPGQDGVFGSSGVFDNSATPPLYLPRLIDTKSNISAEDHDNITNFSSGTTLDSDLGDSGGFVKPNR